MTLEVKKKTNKKIVFSTSDDEEPKVESKKFIGKKEKFSKPKNHFKDNPQDEVPSFKKNSWNGDSDMKTVKLPRPNKKIVFDENLEDEVEEVPKFKKNDDDMKTVKLPRPNNKKIVFEENLEEEDEAPKHFSTGDQSDEEDANASQFIPLETKGEDNKKWYHVYKDSTSVDADIKDHDQQELYTQCKASFEAESSYFHKQNPNDGRWLQTALHKGTSKDRANAGALLITSNPLGNIQALETLIGYTKLSNKSSPEVISILCDLFIEILLPPHRKLMPVQLRGGDWKKLKKAGLSKDSQKRILAYWYYENELKEHYFEFLKNLQQALQTGQENNKNISIVAASKLLAYSPEKEQMLLTMLINKLGDPAGKIASKALHHLSEVAYKHPNMSSVIVVEAEKLLFRNNISEKAQHFTLCFLGQIAPTGRPDVCTKLVNICFALFKVLVQKGAINNRTMQAILRCLQKAIVEAQPPEGSDEIITKDMQDTIYRLVHLADIRIAIQTLSLLLQMVGKKSVKSDRFYNALYKKMLDLNLTNVGAITAANFLHILHKAMHIDSNIPRVLAFIKRLLQLSLYVPAHIAAGCLIIINKLFKSRRELVKSVDEPETVITPVEVDLSRFDDDSDGDEVYKDVDDEKVPSKESKKEKVSSSWHHVNVKTTDASESAVKEIVGNKYDPYHRVPAFAGADNSLRTELLLLCQHFHPTVQVFAESVLNHKRISYYGDPLKDFSLGHFLERFAFKNPKKSDKPLAEMATVNLHKNYNSFGSRGRPVKSLTRTNCTEDEKFIFQYLEKKRLKQVILPKKKEDDDDVGDVDDDEFEAYLDKLGAATGEEDDDDFDEDFKVDYLKEIGGELKDSEKSKKKKKAKTVDVDDDEDMDDIDKDWGDDAEEGDEDEDLDDEDEPELDGENDDDSIFADSDDEEDGADLGDEDDDEDLNGEGDDEDLDGEDADFDDDSGGDDSDDEDDEPKAKKSKGMVGGKAFAKSLKNSSDMSSLFASADDFADLLEEAGKTKGHGTSKAMSNKDKSSEKQLKWEEKRRSNHKEGKFGGHKKFKKPFRK